MALYSTGTKHLESFMDEKDRTSRRLIGEQANVVLCQIESILEALKASRGKWAGLLQKDAEDGLDTIISTVYVMGNYVRDIVYYMSLSSHEDNEDPDLKKKRLETIAANYRFVAKKLEFLQSWAFPKMFRPYVKIMFK